MSGYYQIVLMFEWGGGTLWAGNDAARRDYGVGILDYKLPISCALRRELEKLVEWHDNALDWECPNNPSPWSIKEFQRFDCAANQVKEKLEKTLGCDYTINYIRLGDDL